MNSTFFRRRAIVFLSALSLAAAPDSALAEIVGKITVRAGSQDRRQTIVDFQLPARLRAARALRDSAGRTISLQVDGDGRAAFVLDELAQGASRTFDLTSDEPPASGRQIEVLRANRKLKLNNAGQLVFEYQAEPSDPPRPEIKPIFRRGGYIHPILSPSGRLVTDDYPSNHPHHHGIWFPWTKTEFEGRQPDFWNMGEGKGRVEFVALEAFWSGPVHGGFRARHRFIDLTAPEPKTALHETWEIRLHATRSGVKPCWIFDLVSTQSCASASPLKLPMYRYGGLGFRGNWDWNGPDKTFFLTSDGETNRINGNQSRGRWCHVGGLVDGQLAGVAVLGHPKNFRSPQSMRLHPSEPFFCFAPSQLGDFAIEPGQAYVSCYRFVVADGPADRAEIERLWRDYAEPPEVEVSPQ